LNRHNSSLFLASVEPDQATASQRNKLPWLHQFDQLGDVIQTDLKFDAVCLFHVFEHIVGPAPFLEQIRACLSANAKVIIEVPSLMDPLLKLYENEDYEAFFFQMQHPYNYGPTALLRLLKHNSFEVKMPIAHQRHGIDNHLNWLTSG